VVAVPLHGWELQCRLAIPSPLGLPHGSVGLLCWAGSELRGLRQLGHLRPCLLCREVWHVVLSQPAAHFVALMYEGGTVPVPTRVPLHSAQDAVRAVPIFAVCCAVSACAGATCVELLGAVI